MPPKPKDVDQYLQIGCGRCKRGSTPDCKVRSWTKELTLLRKLLIQSGLTEEIKWSAPCFTYDGRNVVMLGALKESATISFFRGAEMSDPENLLEMPGENSRFVRYLRFTDAKQITSSKKAILAYVREAIEIEASGKKAVARDDGVLEYPDELTQIFDADPDFRRAFSALTPGRQRGYLVYFTSAKQSKTKTARITKSRPQILDGKGWNER